VDTASVNDIIAAVADAGKDIPLRLRRPGGNAATEPGAWKSYRSALSDFGSDIEWAFTERDLFVEWTSPARPKARYDALVSIRSKSVELHKALTQLPPGAMLHSYFPPFANTTGDEPSLGEIVAGLQRLGIAAEAEAARIDTIAHSGESLIGDEGGPGWVADDGTIVGTAEAAFMVRLRQAYQKHLTDSDWKPTLRLSKLYGMDEFTVFVVAVTTAKGEVMKPEAIQKAYRRLKAKAPDKL
jgi:hypothetical protein